MSYHSDEPSFLPGRRWRIGLQVGFLTILVVGVLAMANYLSRLYFTRFHASSRTQIELAPRTVSFLKSVTNQVKVTVYYDKEDPLYSMLLDLLNEYRLASPNITIEKVDYLRDPGAAERVKAAYKLTLTSDKNLVIFECDGRWKTVDGNTLADYAREAVPGGDEPRSRIRPVAFKGEMMFTAVLFAVTNPKPLKAYFLSGNGEHSVDSNDEVNGYLKFAGLLQQNYVQVETLSLLGTNGVPQDCNLLIVAGSTTTIPDPVLDKVDDYLRKGGRLLALFKFEALRKDTGLERVLANWGISVGANVIKDPENTLSGTDVILGEFGRHPVVMPLLDRRLHLILPRTVAKLKGRPQTAGQPRVEEVAFSGQQSFLLGDTSTKQAFPVAVALEKTSITGVLNERGSTRLFVIGDSILFGNRQIESAANRDFAGYVINWLLDRTQLLEGLGPRPITEFRLSMTRTQLRSAQVLLLGGMPGAILLIGGAVWFRRRR
jgi:hypothetical protein